MSSESNSFWRRCSSCKNPIAHKAKHYVCSVSTCNGQRTGYVFCSVPCFERHLPGARHKDAAAIEAFAEAASPGRTIIINKPSSLARETHSHSTPTTREVLVIASRLKEYITARADFNTSASVMDVISDHLRNIADRAIDNARADGRKTVMDKDLQFLKTLK